MTKKAATKTAAKKADETRARTDTSVAEKKAATEAQFAEADEKAAAEASIVRNQVTGF